MRTMVKIKGKKRRNGKERGNEGRSGWRLLDLGLKMEGREK